MSVDRIILRIEGRIKLTRAEAKRFKQKHGSTSYFSITYMLHPDPEKIDDSSLIIKEELKKNYFKMNGRNGDKTLYMERVLV